MRGGTSGKAIRVTAGENQREGVFLVLPPWERAQAAEVSCGVVPQLCLPLESQALCASEFPIKKNLF